MKAVFRVFTIVLAIFVPLTVLAIPNPAATYCTKLGYEYKIVKTPQGEKGIAVVEPGVEFDAWDFFKGKVGNKYSYGAKHGYDTECVREDKGTYVVEYAVCVRKGRKEQTTERIPLLELMERNGESLIDADSYKFKATPEDPYDADEEIGAEYPTKGVKGGSLPSSFCWTNRNGHSYIGDIHDQGGCGSCYAFAACAAAEGTYNWETGNYDTNCADFSESFIIWCLGRLPQYTSHFFGCDGADWDYAELDALTATGVCNEADFSYTETDPGSCTHWDDPKTVFWSWHRIGCNDVDAIKTAIMTYGVVDAAVHSSASPGFNGYSGGIYENSYTNCPPDPLIGTECYHAYTDHAIALVGWNDNGSPETNGYWILRNSWGTSWGENGYMRIKYRAARVACEVCYLTYGTDTAMGTPYSWLDSYGFTNGYEAADTNDADGDGLLTWEEYVTGTDPTNPASVFAILDHGYLDGSNYVVWYSTTNSGVTNAFGMYRSTNLALGMPWVLVTTNSITRDPDGTGTNKWWDEIPPMDVPVFYRPIVTWTN